MALNRILERSVETLAGSTKHWQEAETLLRNTSTSARFRTEQVTGVRPKRHVAVHR
jgi:hypothetical protein